MKTNMKIEIVYLSNNNEYISSIFSCFLLIHSLTYILWYIYFDDTKLLITFCT